MLVNPSRPTQFTKLHVKLPDDLATKTKRYQEALCAKTGQSVSLDETIALLLNFAISKDGDFKKYERQLKQVGTASSAPSF